MNKIISLSLLISLIVVSCTDPDTIGLEVQPTSEKIIINSINSEEINSETESEDFLRTDEALNLVLGEIDDSDFSDSTTSASFLTQVLLTQNNIDLGTNPIVQSVVLSYTYSGYYGKVLDFNRLIIKELEGSIFKDSIYYSNFSFEDDGDDLYSSFILNTDESNPSLQVNLSEGFAQVLLDKGNEAFVDNETFLTHFKGFSVSAVAEDLMLYLNPDGSNSYLKIYYTNEQSDSTLSLDFELGGETARFNLFNQKDEESILSDDSKLHIQSMAGYKVKISLNEIDSLRTVLDQKGINKVTMKFDVREGSESDYAAHDKLFLVRVNQKGENIFLADLTDEGETHFGGRLENNKYEFNITRYFHQLLHNTSYTNDLYLLPAGAAVNANRTILEKDITLTIHYSHLL